MRFVVKSDVIEFWLYNGVVIRFRSTVANREIVARLVGGFAVQLFEDRVIYTLSYV